VAGEVRTCANCGNQQSNGGFCAGCGARLSGVTATAGLPGPLRRLFDFSFQGYVTRDSLRAIFVTTLFLLAFFWLLTLIFGIVAAAEANAFWCIVIFSSFFLVSLMIIWTRIMMELTMTVTKLREDLERAAEQKAAGAAAPKPKK
jgi:hypothetical protein